MNSGDAVGGQKRHLELEFEHLYRAVAKCALSSLLRFDGTGMETSSTPHRAILSCAHLEMCILVTGWKPLSDLRSRLACTEHSALADSTNNRACWGDRGPRISACGSEPKKSHPGQPSEFQRPRQDATKDHAQEEKSAESFPDSFLLRICFLLLSQTPPFLPGSCLVSKKPEQSTPSDIPN